MRSTYSSHFIFASLLAVLTVLAWILQQHVLLRGDVSWLMHLATLRLGGGQYVRDFFEINPPLAVYLYMPAVFLQTLTSLTAAHALFVYCLVLAYGSLLICYYFSRRLFISKDRLFIYTFMITLGMVYLILPLSEFGQREVLSLYLIMPYLLLISTRLIQTKQSLLLACSVGLLAGIGFCIKPHFLLAWVGIETYALLNHTLKKIRPETLCVGFVCIAYLGCIQLFHPTYLSVVVPIARRFYYAYYKESWSALLLNPLCLYILGLLILYSLTQHHVYYKKMVNLFCVTLITFSSIYFLQGTSWYYHLYPAFAIALLLTALLFSSFWKIASSKKDKTIITACLMGSLYYPLICLNNFYDKNMIQKTALQPVSQLLNATEQGKSIYVISSQTSYMPTLIETAHAKQASRVQFLGWLKYYFTFQLHQTLSSAQRQDEDFFVTLMTDDFAKNKPDLVLVDTLFYPTQYKQRLRVNYIPILLHYSQFQKQWQYYHFVKPLCDHNAYCFDLYQRYP